MSEDELSDTPAGNTRHRLSSLGRQSFTPISHRMGRYKSGSSEDVSREPVKSSTRSPGKQRKNQSEKSSQSPNTRKRSPRQQKGKVYPKLDKKRLYPNLAVTDSEEDDMNEDDSDITEDAAIDDEVDFLDDSSNASGRKRINRVIGKPNKRSESDDVISDSPLIRGRRPIGRRPEPRMRQPEEEPAQTQTSSWSFLIPIIAILFIVMGSVRYYNQDQSEIVPDHDPSVDYYKLFKPRLDEIKARYPSQTPRFWRVVNSSIKRLLTEKVDTYPAVLMFGIPEVGSETGTCISKDIVSSLNKFYNSSVSGYIHSRSLNSESPEKMKLDLDEQLQMNLDSGKGVVLDHIENLPAKTALLLHGYCDGDNAPYKSAAIILGLHVSSNKQLRDQDQIIEDILNELWEEELGVDEMPALRSRIANGVTVVNPEKIVKC